MDVNVERWLPVLGVLALFVFEVFLMTWGAEAIADRMLSEIEKHPKRALTFRILLQGEEDPLPLLLILSIISSKTSGCSFARS